MPGDTNDRAVIERAVKGCDGVLTVLVPWFAVVNPNMASSRAGRSSTASLEPPGPFGLNYGARTPAVAIVAHILYGIALGVLLRAT